MTVRKIAAWARERAGSLPRQFALVVAIVVAPVLVALVVGGSLMVVSDKSAALVAAIVAVAGLVAIVAARLVAGGILRDVQAIRDGLTAVGRGHREVRIETLARDETPPRRTMTSEGSSHGVDGPEPIWPEPATSGCSPRRLGESTQIARTRV